MKTINIHKIVEALRWGYGLNYEQAGRWLIRKKLVADMEEYERKLQDPEED